MRTTQATSEEEKLDENTFRGMAESIEIQHVWVRNYNGQGGDPCDVYWGLFDSDGVKWLRNLIKLGQKKPSDLEVHELGFVGSGKFRLQTGKGAVDALFRCKSV